MQQFLQTLVSYIVFYDEAGNPQILETCIAFFGFLFLIYFLLEAFYVVRGSIHSMK